MTQEDEKIDRMVNNFYRDICPFGYLDIKTALEVFDRCNLTTYNLIQEVESYVDDTGIKLSDVDVVRVAFEYVLQQARNEISEVCNIDIQNDLDIYVNGCYCHTVIDYDEDDKTELIDSIKQLTQDDRDELLENEYVKWLLEELEINNF